MTKELKITATLAGDWTVCRFDVEPPLKGTPPCYFEDKASAAGAPLAEALFALEGVRALKIAAGAVTVAREDAEDWPAFARTVATALQAHRASGKPALAPGAKSNVPSEAEIRAKVQDMLDKEINPALAGHGGGVELAGVHGAVVELRLLGGCQGCAHSRMTMRQGIERALRDAIPSLDDVLDVTDHGSGQAPYHHHEHGEGCEH
ncbi:MAG: NifU family protein [Elusimicrobiota bacterium]|jgi:Fe-S cluster biogenesis protein NfuA